MIRTILPLSVLILVISCGLSTDNPRIETCKKDSVENTSACLNNDLILPADRMKDVMRTDPTIITNPGNGI